MTNRRSIIAQDYSAFHVALPSSAKKNNRTLQRHIDRARKGRLKLCTHSVIFEPVESRHPIMKFKFKFSKRKPAAAATFGYLSSAIKDGDLRNGFVLETDKIIEMKVNNENRPYRLVSCVDETLSNACTHVFALVHTNLSTFLPTLVSLFDASKEESKVTSLVRERQVVEFDISYLEDYLEQVQLEHASLVSRVSPLVDNPGCLQITDSNVYFQPATINNVQKEPVTRFPLSSITKMYKRRYMLRQCGLEIFMDTGESAFFSFKNTRERDVVFKAIQSQPALVSVEKGDPMFMQAMTRKWQNRTIDNFTYLMHLNSVADRTVNDLTQYPVMPWILNDYTSPSIDLSDRDVYRDLRKPIGALNEKRLKTFRQRYEQMPTGEGMPPKFMYGTHYSTPGYVLNYLLRNRPEYMLCLQNGRFDHADRLFSDVSSTWDSVITNPADVKELIPEFYDGDGGFLVNSQRLELGTRQDGVRVDDVRLPPWASSPRDFVKTCRAALESDVVSENLHHWIDLIFGYKQRGKEAVRADNVFYYITYEGAVDVDSIKDPVERRSIMLQIREFGQTPKQIFHKPHPRRNVKEATSPPSPSPSVRSRGTIPMPVKETSVSKPLDVSSTSSMTTSTKTIEGNDVGSNRTSDRRGHCSDDLLYLLKSRTPHHYFVHSKSITSVCMCDGVFHSTSEDAGLSTLDPSSLSSKPSVSRGISKLALSAACESAAVPKSLLASSWDGNVYVWSTESRTTVHEFTAHRDAVSCLVSCGNVTLTGSWDSSVKLWDVRATIGRQGKSVVICEHDTEVSCVSITSEYMALTGSCDGQIFIHDLRTKAKTVLSTELGVTSVVSLHVVADGEYFLACGADGIIRTVRSNDGEVCAEVSCGQDDIRCSCMSGSLLLTAGSGGVVRAWDIADPTRLRVSHSVSLVDTSDRNVLVTSICGDASSKMLFAGCDDGSAFLWGGSV